MYNRYLLYITLFTKLLSNLSCLFELLNQKDLIQATFYFKFYLFEAMKKAGVPCVPGSDGELGDDEED